MAFLRTRKREQRSARVRRADAQVVLEGFGPKRNACVAMDLTLPKERVARGQLLTIRDQFRARPFKGEFVVILEGARPARK